MCGIFGWSFKRRSRIPAAQREVLASTLAVANSMRGDQSWGAFYLDHRGDGKLRKDVGDIAAVPGISALGLWDLCMAHTRYATTGKICKQNQHPFRVGNVLLAHNGMVFNHEELNTKYGRTCTVDSQHFAHHVAEGRDFSDVEAYGSLEWMEDTLSRTVNLCRMRRGQLAVYGIRNHKGKQVGIAWSSDAEHLRSAVGAARLDAFPFVKLEEGHVYQVQHGRFYSTKRRLACVEPEWDPRAWSRYQSTQGSKPSTSSLTASEGVTQSGARYKVTVSESGTRTYTFLRDNEDDPSTPPTSLSEWLARKAKEEHEKAEREAGLIEVDQGLFVNENGEIVDPQEEPSDEPPCDTCGSTLGYQEDGSCRECFTVREDVAAGWKRVADMTDEEFARYQERH